MIYVGIFAVGSVPAVVGLVARLWGFPIAASRARIPCAAAVTAAAFAPETQTARQLLGRLYQSIALKLLGSLLINSLVPFSLRSPCARSPPCRVIFNSCLKMTWQQMLRYMQSSPGQQLIVGDYFLINKIKSGSVMCTAYAGLPIMPGPCPVYARILRCARVDSTCRATSP